MYQHYCHRSKKNRVKVGFRHLIPQTLLTLANEEDYDNLTVYRECSHVSTIVQLNSVWQWNNRFDVEAPESDYVFPAKKSRCQQQTNFVDKYDHPLFCGR